MRSYSLRTRKFFSLLNFFFFYLLMTYAGQTNRGKRSGIEVGRDHLENRVKMEVRVPPNVRTPRSSERPRVGNPRVILVDPFESLVGTRVGVGKIPETKYTGTPTHRS